MLLLTHELKQIFYNQSNNLGKLYRETENNTPLYELYETNIDIPINNLSSLDKIYIGDNSIKFTNNSNFSSPYITLNNLVNEISNIKKIYCSKNSPFKLSFLEEWIYQLFSKGFCINRATILDIYNFDIKDIQCYNIFFTKTTGLTLEQILGLKSWNKIKLVSENKWPSFYNFFIKNNNLPKYIPKPGTNNFSYKGNHKILALLYLLYQGQGLTNINKDLKIYAFEGKCFNLNKNFTHHTQQFFSLDPNKNGALEVSAVLENPITGEPGECANFKVPLSIFPSASNMESSMLFSTTLSSANESNVAFSSL